MAVGATFGLAAPMAAQVLEMSRVEALELARALYLDGDAALANAIARRLIEADPRDVEALLILSASEEALGNPQAAFDFGKRAWEAATRADRPAPLRYEIARRTAHAAASAERNLAAQYWLTQSVQVAPGPAQAAQSRSDLATLRETSPIQANLTFQITPTTNLNDGSNTDLFMIDDVIIGTLEGWSEAQPGVIGVANLDLIYALPGQRDRLGLALTEVRHLLAPWAAEANPDLNATDLDQRSAALRFEHDFLLTGSEMPARLTFSGAQSWMGSWAENLPLGLSARAQVEVSLLDQADRAVMLTAIAERQWQDGISGKVDGLSFSLAGTRHVDALAATLQLGLTADVLHSAWSNTTYNAVQVTAGYFPDQPLGPINWSVSVTAGAKDFPVYSLGFANVTRGRQDFSLGVNLTLEPQEAKVIGLTPYVTLGQLASWSNVSRNDTQSLSVSLGLSRAF